MEPVPFKRTHVELFLRCAKAEGWITDRREMEFLLRVCPAGCRVCLCEGEPAAFITAIRYERSAWIGNLLVRPDFRQRGIGRALMQQVLHGLDLSGCETVWLTASSDGAHLYRTLGFVQADRVQRWRGAGNWKVKRIRPAYAAAIASLDCKGWDDSRRLIFDNLPGTSSCFRNRDGFLLHTATGDGLHIGPWGAASEEAAATLLAAALSGEGSAMEIVLDVPEKNHAAAALLAAKGFSVSGSTLLMYRGSVPAYRPEHVYSLASMGSYG